MPTITPQDNFFNMPLEELFFIFHELDKNIPIEKEFIEQDARVKEAMEWEKERFNLPFGKSLKFYKALLKDTKNRIKIHKELWRKDHNNFWSELSMNKYIEKEKNIKKKIAFFDAPIQNATIDVARAKSVPIPMFIEFNTMHFARCIFHNEKSPSMKYYPNNNSVYCFGCGRAADVIDIVQHQQNISFINAVKLLSNDNPRN